MTILDLPQAPSHTTFRWPRTLVAHLMPAAAAVSAALALAPLMDRVGLPRGFALTLAFALVLTPIELAVLCVAARRATGRWAPITTVLSYRGPLRRSWWLVPVLFGIALAALFALMPVRDTLAGWLPDAFPSWLLPDYDDSAGFSRPVLVATLLITLLVDGIVNPTVEECYFRGYLLPRIPVAGWRAVPVSAALFAVQHYWQPYNWLLIFFLQLVVTALVVRLRRLRLGIVMHVLTNCFGTLITLAMVLS